MERGPGRIGGWRQPGAGASSQKSEAARPQTRQPSSLSQYPALEKADIRPLPPQCGSSRCRSTQRERILIGHRASRRSETLSGHRHSSRKVLRDPALRSTKSLASYLRQQCRFEDAGTRNSEVMDIRLAIFAEVTVVDAEVTVEVAPEGSRLLHTRQG